MHFENVYGVGGLDDKFWITESAVEELGKAGKMKGWGSTEENEGLQMQNHDKALNSPGAWGEQQCEADAIGPRCQSTQQLNVSLFNLRIQYFQ